MANVAQDSLKDVAGRIREMREISGFSEAEMAEMTEVSVKEYRKYEKGEMDFPFTFLHKCANAFGIELTQLLEGKSAHLSMYTVTRKGGGQKTARENGIFIDDLAPKFRKKLAVPYYSKYEYDESLQNKPIALTKHDGQECDYVLTGRMKIQIGNNFEVLNAGDCIFYNSSIPHGIIAVGGDTCEFLAYVMSGQPDEEQVEEETKAAGHTRKTEVSRKFIDCIEDEKGRLKEINFHDTDSFNFGYDVVDAIAEKNPTKLAMLHIGEDGTERRFTFGDIKKASNRTANFFKSLGIKKGDKVMVVLRRHYQFWFTMVALHKLGAVAIPGTDQLLAHDFEYRFDLAEVSAVVCTAHGKAAEQVDIAQKKCPGLKTKILVNGSREGWHDFNEEYRLYSTHFDRTEDTSSGEEVCLMFFTSGTTGYPKIAAHSHTYALGHYITAKYWHGVSPHGLHFTISDTGWGKALWGKLYGQWLAEGAVFVYDFDRFHASEILPMFAKYNITTFCAPPTMLRFMIKEDLSKYDLSSIVHMTTAGEALNPEVYKQFKKLTGIRIMEGFGQTETTLSIGNLMGEPHKLGSMGRPSPLYDVTLMDENGDPVPDGEQGEIVIKTSDRVPCGLFKGYYNDPERTEEVWHDGYYHTGDTAWRDEDGFLWYVGRTDDVIKSSGYRIGPFEIESVIMELPYVIECGVSAEPDPIRGQVVKASIVLVKGTEGTEELKKEIQDYVKKNTAPYKYPRIVVFRDSLPKSIGGKIQRNKL